MSPEHELPQPISETISRVVPEGEVRMAAASDIAEDGSYGERWIALAGERLLVISPNGGEPTVGLDLPVKDISEISIDNLVGGSMLQAVVEGRKVDLLPYTSALTNRFARFRTQLDAVVKEKPVPDIPEETHICPTCGLNLGEVTRVCPRCLRKGVVLRRLLGYARSLPVAVGRDRGAHAGEHRARCSSLRTCTGC